MVFMFEVIHYFWQMYLKILEINLLKCMTLIFLIFCLLLDQHGKLKTKVELELITDADMLLMVERGIRGETFRGMIEARDMQNQIINI